MSEASGLDAVLRGIVGELAPNEAISVLRRRLDLSQHDVAVGIGVSQNIISMYETGSKTIPQEHMERLLAFYVNKLQHNRGDTAGEDRTRTVSG